MRRFAVGDQFGAKGFGFRVVKGAKGPADFVLEIFSDGRWRKVPMALGAVFADFFYENEEATHLRSEGYQGGGKYVGYLKCAIEHGWAKADASLDAEKAQRRLWEEPGQ